MHHLARVGSVIAGLLVSVVDRVRRLSGPSACCQRHSATWRGTDNPVGTIPMKGIAMSKLRRITTALTGILLALAAALATAPAAFAMRVAPPPGDPGPAATPTYIVTHPGIAGWQVALIAVGAFLANRLRAPAGTVGRPVPAGTAGVVQAPLTPLGTVLLGGETWSARTPDDRPVERGAHVRLVRLDGLTAIVEPLDPADAPPISTPPASPTAGPT